MFLSLSFKVEFRVLSSLKSYFIKWDELSPKASSKNHAGADPGFPVRGVDPF